jgi:hypothetical protein
MAAAPRAVAPNKNRRRDNEAAEYSCARARSLGLGESGRIVTAKPPPGRKWLTG